MVDDIEGEAELLQARINQIIELGVEGAISPDDAKTMPTSVLVMSVIKFPDLIMEAGSLLPAAMGESQEMVNGIKASMQAVSESLKNCCMELDERIPSRDTTGLS